LKFDKTGNLYIAENGKHVVRKISTSGIITTIAGIGIQGYNGDGISATAAKLNYPEDIEMDGLGNIYISDEGNYRIRKISSSGIITTYGGTGGSIYGGDGMPATDAQFTPTFIKFDLMHNLYISGDRRVSKIDPSGIFHRVTGDGSATNTGDGGIALAASIYDPIGLSVDKCNNLYISLRVANKIRKIAFNPPPCNYLNVTDYIDQPAIPIFPIPTFNILNIENIITKTFYTIRNLIGANVQQGHLTQGNNTISLLQLPPGMYMLVLTDEDGKKTVKKIIKQ
jgi:hypothetical protein